MCGIYCSVSRARRVHCGSAAEQALKCRGPDSIRTLELQHSITVSVEGQSAGTTTDLCITLCATVLSLRGDHVVAQPLIDRAASGSALCWNGEAWSFAGEAVEGNDSQYIFDKLLLASAKDKASSLSTTTSSVKEVIRSIKGPFAFVFYDVSNSRLWYGRDCIGRRSLLFSSTEDAFTLCSIADHEDARSWHEVKADGIYVLDLNSTEPLLKPQRLPWNEDFDNSFCLSQFNDTLPTGSVLPPLLTQTSPNISKLETLLTDSLKTRLLTIPTLSDANRTNLAILFSGGLDCTLLARLSHTILPENQTIDLLNIAFENPRIHKENSPESPYELCPDRITARSSLSELEATCPTRTWRLVEINIPYSTLLDHRPQIKQLMAPHNTEMDLSIASALYFAARGTGYHDGKAYTTPSRVLLSGLGADELFGGYTRHATSFSRRGFPGLVAELHLDVSRLGQRNLGRDDRVTAHWGREVRYPYLDEDFVSWAVQASVWEKCGFGCVPLGSHDAMRAEEEGIEPGKLALRLLALRLGMPGVAGEKKRAIQFGARTAKMETGKSKGTDRLGSD